MSGQPNRRHAHRHPELVSGSICRDSLTGGGAIGIGGLLTPSTGRTARWTLKRVQGDEVVWATGTAPSCSPGEG
ncbi:hypothetical protein NOVOSPHI9U_420333 [Novosphingobium sp. 9U]|nr:hypothetical protein NOVOSPHI9U_420333 [Novosphingobium sp. 9U]